MVANSYEAQIVPYWLLLTEQSIFIRRILVPYRGSKTRNSGVICSQGRGIAYIVWKCMSEEALN